MLIRDLFEQLSQPGSPYARRLLCCLLIGAFVQAPKLLGDDPWPFWQRTVTRLGRTDTIGPRTPNVAWRVRFDPTEPCGSKESGTVMDSAGRLYVGTSRRLTCVDTRQRRVLWEFPTARDIVSTPATFEGRVFFGTSSAPPNHFYCVDAETGRELWNRPTGIEHVNSSPVVWDGIVYFNDTASVLYALRVEDGAEVWTRRLDKGLRTSPTLDPKRGLLLSGGLDFRAILGFDLADGRTRWEAPVGGPVDRGVVPLENGRFYIGTRNDRKIYCFDAEDGQEIWRFTGGLRDFRGSQALGQPEFGRLYAATTLPNLYCLDAATGREIWRFEFGNVLVTQPPIVDGREMIYLTNTRLGLFAIRPDGTQLWNRRFPNTTFPSPMLGPDGTLYIVCEDNYIYALRDKRGDLNCDGSVDLTDVEPFIMVLLDPDMYQRWNPDCNAQLADMTEDGSIDLSDVEPFIECILGERCP